MANAFHPSFEAAESRRTSRSEAIGNFIYAASRALAWFGALVLAALAVISVASIIGRSLAFAGLGPVRGDFELVEAGAALAVFSFLPWCHLKRGHAVVDLLWSAYPPPMRWILNVFADLLMFVVWVLLVWRMGLAMLEYRANGETTFILHMPVWWAYAASLIPAALGCLIYAWRLLESLGLVAQPREYQRAEPGGH
ncbi:MAG TPA: TRAP transporter small permease [Burkholderiaceae bacterium]|nr:TRAP transporter small permease [Burkholderiaceae bacterium]